MIDYEEIGNDGEKWELFARDFFSSLGYSIECSPDRGADGGKDLLMTEHIKGHFSSYSFKWLVSCKNFIQSNRSVNESKDEPNILERCKTFNADGFMGFYSTIASSGLNNRLIQLKENQSLRDFQIFDGKSIECTIMTFGLSNLLFRYFPESYKRIRPLHKLYGQFVELKCRRCGRNLFEDIEQGLNNSVIAHVEKPIGDKTLIDDCYVACKGECDKQFEVMYAQQGYSTPWNDLTVLANPIEYLHYIMVLISQLHNSAEYIYSDRTVSAEKHILAALAQKVFHEVTESERRSFQQMLEWGLL